MTDRKVTACMADVWDWFESNEDKYMILSEALGADGQDISETTEYANDISIDFIKKGDYERFGRFMAQQFNRYIIHCAEHRLSQNYIYDKEALEREVI